MLAIREWRHLKMAKRTGRGHDPSGIAGTAEGGFAIPCRVCPQPGINLPDDWASAPPSRVWLYNLSLSMDANFRLKNRCRSSWDKDPSLGPGYAYFVKNQDYIEHVANYAHEDEVRLLLIIMSLLSYTDAFC
jgi:hypothetical protein